MKLPITPVLLCVSLWISPADLARRLGQADELAARARAAEPAQKEQAVEAALEAYAALLALRPKDREWVPKVRRRRAALLKRAGRVRAALAEHDAILRGPAQRRDRARALRDGARVLQKGGDFTAAVKRCRRVVEEFGDIGSVAAEACLLEGRCHEAMARAQRAGRAYRVVVERYHAEAKHGIAAYDALALLAIEARNPVQAGRWLQACAERYGKRAARKDKRGQYLGRLLGEMKAPARLAAAE
jgi:tetratricopeptide (TPR) repeat protein